MTPNRLAAIAFRWSISAVFALRVLAPIAQAQSAVTAINGVYNGSYTCAQGPRTLRLSLLTSGNGSLTGVFTFYLPPTSHTQAFSYSLSGTFDSGSGKFKLNPGKWEVPPPENYAMVGMDGAFDPGTGQVAGKITYGSCRTFQAVRDQAASANNAGVSAPQKVEKVAGAAQPVPKTAAPAERPLPKPVTATPPPPMAVGAGNTDSGRVLLSACNAGKVDIDVFISESGKVSSSHIGAADCALIAESVGSMGPAYVGLAFVDARGQWGAARRQDLLPDFGIGALPGIGVLSRANQSVPVRHGNTTVSLPMQILFQPRVLKCTSPSPSASSQLRYNATGLERALAEQNDANSSRLGLDRPSCESLGYVLNVAAYPDSREITFNKFCEPCDKKAEARITPEERAARQQRSDAVNQEIETLKATGPLGALLMGNVVKQGKQAAQEEEREREEERRQQQPESYRRMNWNEMNLALANVHGSGGRPREMPQYLIIRGTVSRVDISPPGASDHWVDVYFRESSEQASTVYETVYGAFNVCTSNANIFEDMFGPDFRSRMIGKVLEVEGEYQRNYCKGWKGSIRVTLARQVHSVGAAR